ncbi:MAG: LacI family DNA-binding transcriptional regulator [Verrucomicrobia bacterium]|nr:LacI family DNA-binding transcriptional regulator [Verrucomicrobiota bacterium]
MARRSKLTMDDVARVARVSKQTVSAVINNKSGISEKTRARIRQIIARLDYQPNLLAGSLRAQRSYTVGVVIPSITNPFYPELVRGIEDEAQGRGYTVFLCNSDENPEKAANYLQLLRRQRIAGLVAVAFTGYEGWTLALRNVAAQGIPVVVLQGVSRPSEDVVHITADDEAGFVLATSHLLDLGHQRIGMILPPPEAGGESPRLVGFLRAHAVRGKKVQPELLVPGGWHVTEGQTAAGQLMSLSRPPTAIVAANDMAAIGAITRLKELGYRVPEDVAVVGCDNIDISEWYDPALTTVDQPHYQMGRKAMVAMLRRLEDPSAPAEVVKFETSLIIRRSSGEPVKARKRIGPIGRI